MFSHTWEFKVRFGETDAAGIVYYPNFYKWMDQGTQEMFAAMDLSVRRLFTIQQGIPLVEAQCQFIHSLVFDDWIQLISTVAEVRNKVVKIEHRFYRGETLIASGYEIRAWIGHIEGVMKAQTIPDEVRQKLLAGE